MQGGGGRTFMSMVACGGGVGAGSGVGGGLGVGGGVGSPSARARRRPEVGHSVSSRSGLAGGSGPSSCGNGSSMPSEVSDDASDCDTYTTLQVSSVDRRLSSDILSNLIPLRWQPSLVHRRSTTQESNL